jgi:hypothetical protein
VNEKLAGHLLAVAALALALAALASGAGGASPEAALRALRGLAGAALVGGGMAATGGALLNALEPGRPAPLAAAWALGGAALGTALLIPAMLGLAWPGAVAPGIAALALLRRPQIAWPTAPAAAWIAGLALLAPGLLDALAPPVDTDEIYYHLALPAMWLREGALPGGVWVPDGSRPLSVQLVSAAALQLGGEPGPKLLAWLGAIALALAVREIGERRLRPGAGDLAALLLLGSYSALRESGLAYNNLPAALCVAWALDAALSQGESQGEAPGERRGWRMALFAGAALATKYTAAAPVVGIYLLWWRRRGLRAVGALAALTAAALAWCVPWWLRNIAAGLHPLFPYAGWPALDGFQFMYLEKYGAGRALPDLLALPWRVTVDADPAGYSFLGRITPAGLACLPAALWAGLRGRAPVVGVAVVAAVAWAAGVHSLRLLLPAAAPLALAGAAGWALLPRWGRAAVGAVWLLGLPANLGPWLADVADRAPAAVGAEPREDLLARRIRSWPAVAWINEYTPEDARVALLFTWPRYHLERPVLLGSVEDHVPTRYLIADRGPEALAALRAEGVTYVVAHSRPFIRKTYRFLDDAAWRAQFEAPVDALSELLLAEGVLVYESGRVGVWRLPEPP